MKDKATILVVDDQPQNIELLEACLVPQGYAIVRALSGEDALEKLAGDQIDLILLDVKMPGIDGFEVTRRIRQDDTHRLLPIILVTALKEKEDRIKGIEAGCDDFLSTPFDNMELLARIRSLLKIKAYNDLMKNYRHELESEVTRRVEELEHAMESLRKDIAERKRAEKELQESEKKYRWLLDNMTDVLTVMDMNLRFTYVSPSIMRMRGYTAEEAMAQTFEQVMTPESLQISAKVFEEEMKLEASGTADPGRTRIMELAQYRKDGSIVWMENSLSYMRDEAQKPVGIISVSRDITDRKIIEDALKESENKYRLIAERMVDVITIADMNLRFTYISPSIIRMRGFTVDEAMAQTLEQVMTPASMLVLLRAFEEEMQLEASGTADPDRTRIMELEEYRKDGSTLWVETTFSFIRDKYRNPLGILTLSRDIAERKQWEESLLLSEEKFRKAFLTSPDAITISCLADGMFVSANQGFFDFSGYTEKEVIGKTSFDIHFFENSEDRKKIIERLSAEGSFKNFESRFRKKNGDFVFGLMSASVILLDKVPHLLTITRDITDRKRAEEEKARLEALLQQSQKMEAIGTLAGGIAHDFNNILTAIMGYTELAISDFPQGSDTRDNLDEVAKASGRAKNLVKQILMFSRQSENKVLLIHLHLIIKEAIKLLRSSLPATIEIKQNIQASGKVLADPTQMHQIIMNLCTNASQAMFENGGELSVGLIQVNVPNDKSAPKNLPPGHYLKLTVSDTGCGMAPDVINRIFEPYFTTKEKDKGTGLGLSMVHGIVHSHGGLITVESALGKGSSFHVYLPEVIVSGEAKEMITVEEPVYTGTERILVVDDEQIIVKMVKKILGRLGYEVVGRSSSVEALELFKANPDQFDLVITDMTMPHMTGDQLSRKLIEIRPDIPIILCSGFSEKLTASAAEEIGIREFVMKPVSRQVLSKIIRNALDGVLRPDVLGSPRLT